jgi:hypothetical protein
VIATTKGTERLVATKETGATAAAVVYRIVAAGLPGQAALPCAALVTCMKGTDLKCGSDSVACARAEDRSEIVATLEYNSLKVDLRELDADVLFGIDDRGAFALHKTSRSVLYTPGVKWPAWPSVNAQAGTAVVLKAVLDPATKIWRVTAETPAETPTGSPDKLMPLWITLIVIGGIAFIAMIIFLATRK